ncbi:MAG: ATP-binding protein [Treponemataceae bacterium]|nr:ATP-binding protein [Spirochaetales bacterium]MDY6031770.1 ATP-binding protein [Treponemataceae bacterium]
MKQIKREIYLSQIRKFYELDLIKVLTGVRRSGKSIILNQIIEELKQKTDIKHIIYINFEDFEFEEIDTAKKLHEFIKTKISDSKKYYILFDEIQHVKEFEKALASFRATINCSLFVTGSNSKLLSGELATLLVGRTVEFKIMPFSYSEAVRLYEENKKAVQQDFIYDYIKWGGLPQRFDFSEEKDIKNYIESVFKGIVEKDIYKRDSEIEKYKFNTISSYILSNAGKEFSSQNIVNFYNNQNEANKKTFEKKTIYNYLEKLEKAYLISRVKRFNIVGKEILKTIEKQYAIDTGFRTINTNLVNYEDTFFLENIIYNELILRGYSVYTGKTYKGEIDFVAIDGNRKCFIQVSYLMPTEEIIRREFEAFKPIKDASPKYVLSLDKIDLSRDGIIHLNIEDFLLHKKDLILS